MYEEEFRKIDTNTVEQAKARAAYEQTLTSLQSGFRQRGDLDGTVAVLQEQQRFRQDGNVPAAPAPATHAAVASAQAACGATMTRVEEEKQRLLARLKAAYARSLGDLVRKHVRANAIEDAKAANVEPQRIEAELATHRETVRPPDKAPEPAVVTYSERSAFAAAAGPLKPIDFGKACLSGQSHTPYHTADGLAIDAFRFVGVKAAGGYGCGVFLAEGMHRSGWSGDPVTLMGPSSGHLLVTPPANVTAVGFELYTVSGSDPRPFGQDVHVTLSDGDRFIIRTHLKPRLAFAGFVCSRPITTIRIETVTGVHNPCISAFVYRQADGANAIPRPAGLW